MEHPSGLTTEAELAFVSAEFWCHPDNLKINKSEQGTWSEPGVWERLLAFQQGWKACKDFYSSIND